MKISYRLQILSLFFLSGLFGFTFVPGDLDLEKSTVSLTPNLRLAKSEVTNHEYRQFINTLKTTGKPDLAKKYSPDTTVWTKLSYAMGDPMMQYYFAHPAFDNYPVVGITHEAAIAYCTWMTEEEYKKLSGNKFASKITYRLPTKSEWELAAKLNSSDAVYAGGWTKIKKNVLGKKEPNGYYFNHRIAEDNFYEDGYSYTGPANRNKVSKDKEWTNKSMLKADKNGFYHLAGNVAELIDEKGISVGGGWNDYEDKARIGVTNVYSGPNAWTGFRYIIEYSKSKN